MELWNEVPDDTDEVEIVPVNPSDVKDAAPVEPNVLAHVKRIQEKIASDKRFHSKAFTRMRRDMFMARKGYDPKQYPGATSYVANICGRHVKQKTAALYAKNPKAVARRKERLDFAIWDEDPKSLMMAMQTVEMAQQAIASAPQQMDPVTREVVPALPAFPPEMEEAFKVAQETLADYQQGMARRRDVTKLGKTLEILYAQALSEQKPLDFKSAMKKLVRRTCTTGVGYAELGFQRQYGPRPGMTEKLADARTRLDHLRSLAESAEAGDFDPDDAEIAELQTAVAALEIEPEIILREGLIIDYPPSTRVIPDELTRSIVGFIGANVLTVEYLFTVDQVKEMFGVDLGKNYRGYSVNGSLSREASERSNYVQDDDPDMNEPRRDEKSGCGMVCVWKHFDKPSGLVYYVADGYDRWLREPAAPDVFVEDFWPVYALTFNDVEDENELFPPSDVTLMNDQQHEYNRSRQGQREHRKAARPRWAGARGALDEEAIKILTTAEPFTVSLINRDPTTKLSDLLEPIQVPGVDPNLYSTDQYFTDIQFVVGTQEAQFGGIAKATATESAISAGASATSDGSSIDDLDAFLTSLARASGQILLKEMSEEQVKVIAGPGAYWPHQSLAEIADEIFLEVQAGSSGKPNQAVEVQKWTQLAPILERIPGISPTWFARETIRRLDDNADLTEAMAEGLPSIMAQNKMNQTPPPGVDPNADPNAQGEQGADNAPTPSPQPEGGSDAAFGSNQTGAFA